MYFVLCYLRTCWTPFDQSDRKTLTAICDQWPSRLRPRIDGKAVTGSGTDVRLSSYHTFLDISNSIPLQVKNLAVRLAGVKIDDHKGSPAVSRFDNLNLERLSSRWETKSSGSISIGSAVLHAEDALEQIGHSIDFAKDVLHSENLADLDDLDEARGTLNELSEKKDALSDFKRENPGFEHYKVCPTFLFPLSFWHDS